MFSDKTNSINLETPDFTKIKGHTKIELTSVIDGAKKIIEHDNDFQAGVLAKYMRSLGRLCLNPFNNTTWDGYPLWRNLVGGIFLFSEPIDNSEGEVEYMPKGNMMVANGCYGVSNTSHAEFGSYNSNESIIGSDSLVLVYDWGTSQANGTIGCVSLTSENGGYIGYGNPSNTAVTRRQFRLNQATRNFSGFFWNNRQYTVAWDDRTKILTVSGADVTTDMGSLFDGVAAQQLVAYNVPSSWTGYLDCLDYETGKIYFWQYNTNVKNGSSILILEFDANTETMSETTLINTTGDTLGFYQNYPERFKYVGGKLYVPASRNTGLPLFEFERSGSNWVFTGKSTSQILSGAGYGTLFQLKDSIKFATQGVQTSAYAMDVYACVDEETDTWRVTNGQKHNTSVGQMNYDMRLDVMVDYYSPLQSSNTVQFYKNPLYLATINNLDTPVTKDNTQTMKVTYTLTEVDE